MAKKVYLRLLEAANVAVFIVVFDVVNIVVFIDLGVVLVVIADHTGCPAKHVPLLFF